MAKKSGITLPSGMGGLTVIKEEYDSKLKISPTLAIVLIAIFAGLLLALKFIL